jgi:hypothetical protein
VSLSNVIAADVDPVEEIRQQLGYVRDGAGDRFDQLDIELTTRHIEITDDVDGALHRMAQLYRVDADHLRDHPLVLVGSVGSIADQLERRRSEHGINYTTIPYPSLEAMAPVIERLVGS